MNLDMRSDGDLKQINYLEIIHKSDFYFHLKADPNVTLSPTFSNCLLNFLNFTTQYEQIQHSSVIDIIF